MIKSESSGGCFGVTLAFTRLLLDECSVLDPGFASKIPHLMEVDAARHDITITTNHFNCLQVLV